MRSSALLQNVLGCLRLQKDICIRYILLLLLRHLMNSFQMGFNMRNISTKERVRVQNNQKIKDFVFQTKTSMYMVDYWTGVRYVLNFEATKTVSTQQTIRVHVSQKSKTCRTHVQQFFIWTFADNDLSVRRTKFWLQGSSCFKLRRSSMAFIQGNLNFYLSMLQLSPPPLLPHLKLPGSDRIFVLGSYMICLIVASSSYTFFFVYYCSACASHGLEQIRLSWA